jgi:hypothetical protein
MCSLILYTAVIEPPLRYDSHTGMAGLMVAMEDLRQRDQHQDCLDGVTIGIEDLIHKSLVRPEI